MVVHVEKFQAIILNKKENEAKYKQNMDNNGIEFTRSVKLLVITTDGYLIFDQHKSSLFSRPLCN